MSRLRVLLFDVFGTLVDWRSSLIAAAEEAGQRSGVEAAWPTVIDDWRRAYQPALDAVRGGRDWRDLDSLQRETLADVLTKHGVDLPAEEREWLVSGWRRLKSWPDSAAGLDALRRNHVTATLSNGHIALLVELLRFADLRVDAVLSAELASSYKPEPVVYLTALRLLGVDADAAGMVAAHRSDLEAATGLGLRPILIRRPLEWGLVAAPPPEPTLERLVVADDLLDLATQLDVSS